MQFCVRMESGVDGFIALQRQFQEFEQKGYLQLNDQKFQKQYCQMIQDLNDLDCNRQTIIMRQFIDTIKIVFDQIQNMQIHNLKTFWFMNVNINLKKLVLINPECLLFQLQYFLFLEEVQISTSTKFHLSELEFSGDYISTISISTETLMLDNANFQAKNIKLHVKKLIKDYENIDITEFLEITIDYLSLDLINKFSQNICLIYANIIQSRQVYQFVSMKFIKCYNVESIDFTRFVLLQGLQICLFQCNKISIESFSLNQIEFYNCKIILLDILNSEKITQFKYINTNFGKIIQNQRLEIITDDCKQNICFLFNKFTHINSLRFIKNVQNFGDKIVNNFLKFRYLHVQNYNESENIHFYKVIKSFEILQDQLQ